MLTCRRYKIYITKIVPSQLAPALAATISIAFLSIGHAQQAIPAATEPSIGYTIQPGEKLIRLGQRLLKNPEAWPEVASFNKLGNANALKPGQTIQLPLRLLKPIPANGKVVSVSGDVQLGSSPAAAGTTLVEGSRLQTGANSSAVIELADGSRVTLLPNTLAELATSQNYATRDARSSASTTRFSGLIRLVQGSLDTAAEKLAKRATPLQIQTPTSLVGVRGTQFRVAFDDPVTQNARTEVLEGLVQADNPAQGSSAALPTGKGAVLNPAVKEIKVVDLLKAPDLSATPADIFKPLALWPMPGLEGAASFRVQVASDASFHQIVRDLVVTTGSADLASLPNGSWFARIRGIDAVGIEGYDSVKSVRVALAPPHQWRIDNDRIDLNNGRHVLRFTQQGLNADHTVTASVSAEQAPSTTIVETTVVASANEVQLDLGNLQAGARYLLRMTVVQRDGSEVVALTYRFVGLSGSGWVRNTLELVRP